MGRPNRGHGPSGVTGIMPVEGAGEVGDQVAGELVEGGLGGGLVLA